MLKKDILKCREFLAGDETILREIFNPHKDDIAIRYSLAHAKLGPKEASLSHRLKTSEVYFILEGMGEMDVDGERAEVSPGFAIYIPPQSVQKLRNTGETDLLFLCIVDPAWRPEDEEVLE